MTDECTRWWRLYYPQIERLIKNFVDVNSADYDNRTALHLACAEGHNRVVSLLIWKHAQLDLKDRWGVTPLQDAIDEPVTQSFQRAPAPHRRQRRRSCNVEEQLDARVGGVDRLAPRAARA